jgi:hypothetical protein
MGSTETDGPGLMLSLYFLCWFPLLRLFFDRQTTCVTVDEFALGHSPFKGHD